MKTDTERISRLEMTVLWVATFLAVVIVYVVLR
jgi:hypothetical protein